MAKTERRLGRALLRGVRGRCPACGRGRLLRDYLRPNAQCSVCGEDFTRYQTADFAPYLVTFFVGLIFTPLALVLTASDAASDSVLFLLLFAAVGFAVLLLPLAKGAAMGLLWAIDEAN